MKPGKEFGLVLVVGSVNSMEKKDALSEISKGGHSYKLVGKISKTGKTEKNLKAVEPRKINLIWNIAFLTPVDLKVHNKCTQVITFKIILHYR